MTRLKILMLAMAALTLCACKDGSGPLLPKSGGRPYEVLVIATDSACKAVMDSLLSQDMPGLPQSEPLFDTSIADSTRLDQSTRTARSIVIVSVDPLRFTSTKVKYEKNVWAKPQMVVYINTPSPDALKHDMDKNGHQVTDLLTRAEINAALSASAKGGNRKAETYINKVFGIKLDVPSDMKSEKKGQDFIWISDNAASGMKSICVYTYKGKDLDAAKFVAARDSIMEANIPGERRGMYMQTTRGSVTAILKKEKGHAVMECRGLWEMHGDAMGGPFVALATTDPKRDRIIVTEAFVYAPEMKKRNLIRQTEAALYSAFVNKNGEIND